MLCSLPSDALLEHQLLPLWRSFQGASVSRHHMDFLDSWAARLRVCLIQSGQTGCEWGDKNSETHTSRPNFLCTSLWILHFTVWNSIHPRDGIIYSLWNEATAQAAKATILGRRCGRKVAVSPSLGKSTSPSFEDYTISWGPKKMQISNVK